MQSCDPPPQPPTEVTNDSESPQNIEETKIEIRRVSREESNRKYHPNRSYVIFKYTKTDTKYLHSIIKHNTWYWQDENQTCSVYHFADDNTAQEFMKEFDKNKVSSNFIILSGKEIDSDDMKEVPADEEGWTKVLKTERRPKPATNENPAAPTNSTNENPAKQQNTEQSSDNVIKIHNHLIKSGNPLYLKSVCTQHKITLPARQFYSHKLKLTTLEFADKKSALTFMEKIPTALFGDKASYELYTPKRQGQTPRDTTQDWNAVIRGVDPEIDIQDFEKEMKEHGIQFRKMNRIVTPNGDKTHMIRVFFEDENSTKQAIFNGITILGRRFKVEPPRVDARHLPCRNCGQYGHTANICKNSSVCFKCGGRPGSCTHPPYANIMFCATCRSNDHFTGQIRCRLYPRSSPAPDQARQLPLIKQNTTSPPRPSTVNFPAISQSVWTKNPLTDKPTAESNTTLSGDTENKTKEQADTNKTESLVEKLTQKLEKLEDVLSKVMKFTTTMMETYIDSKITTVLNQMIKFTTTIVHNATTPSQRQIVTNTANSTAKQIWVKRVQVVPLKNSIEIMVSDMREGLSRDFEQIINETINNPTQSPTTKESDPGTSITS